MMFRQLKFQLPIWLSVILALLPFAVGACRSLPQAVSIRDIKPLKEGGQVEVNKDIGIAFEVDNPGDLPLTYEWVASEGTFKVPSKTTRSAIYVAPDKEGLQLITVQAMHEGKVVAEGSIQIEVVESATATIAPPMPTNTSSSTKEPIPTQQPTQEPTRVLPKKPTEESTLSIAITEPQKEVECPPKGIGCTFTITGTMTGVAAVSPYKIVPFVNPSPGVSNTWFPQPDRPQLSETWQAKVRIGTEEGEEPGHHFEVAVLIMDAKTQIRTEFQPLPPSVAQSNIVDLVTTAISDSSASTTTVARPIWCTPFSRPPIAKAELQGKAKLTFPADCAELQYINVLVGASSDLPEDEYIWVLVYPKNARYYPQSDNAADGLTIRPNSDGSWSITTYLGTPTSGREKFDIVVVLANREASNFFSNTMKAWAATGGFPGLSYAELPAGIAEVQSITAMRTQ